MEKKVLIGTSGWSYDEWIGPFYPKGLTQKDFLLFYSEVFYTNEINTTFYNIPSKWIVDSWIKRTPSNFVFSAKIPQSITHIYKLNVDECLKDLNFFLDAMDPMIKANKLLAFLIQLPPSFTREKYFGILKEFIDCWPQEINKESYHLVVEFRHKSWMDQDVFTFLRNNSLTYCAVVEPLLPPRMDVTNPELAYIRFHGYGKKIWFDYFFSDEEIRQWAKPIKNIIDKARIISIYFNNHFSGYAAKNSLMMMQELNLSPKNDPETIDMLDIKKKSGTYSKGQMSLDRFIPKS